MEEDKKTTTNPEATEEVEPTTETTETEEVELTTTPDAENEDTTETEDANDETEVNVEDYTKVVEQLQKANEEADKWKAFSRKNEEDKKTLGLELNKMKLAKEFNLNDEAMDLISAKTADDQRKQAEKLQSLIKTTTTQQQPKPNPLQGLTQEDVNFSTSGEDARKKFNEFMSRNKR